MPWATRCGSPSLTPASTGGTRGGTGSARPPRPSRRPAAARSSVLAGAGDGSRAARGVRGDPRGGVAGSAADALVSATGGCALAVLTADCAPVALASPEGVIGVAHAGWRGLVAGVLRRTVEQMGALG